MHLRHCESLIAICDLVEGLHCAKSYYNIHKRIIRIRLVNFLATENRKETTIYISLVVFFLCVLLASMHLNRVSKLKCRGIEKWFFIEALIIRVIFKFKIVRNNFAVNNGI